MPLDLTPIVESLREHLRGDLLRELGGDRDHAKWPEWMSVETAANYLDVTVERVRKLKDRREIPYYQEAPGCRVFFRRSELDEWMSGFRRATRRL